MEYYESRLNDTSRPWPFYGQPADEEIARLHQENQELKEYNAAVLSTCKSLMIANQELRDLLDAVIERQLERTLL